MTKGQRHFILLSFDGQEVHQSPKVGLMDSLEEIERISERSIAIVKIDTSNQNLIRPMKGSEEDLRFFMRHLDNNFPGWKLAQERKKNDSDS